MYDLCIDRMTLILKPYLDIIMMYYYAKNEVSMSIHSKVVTQQTDTQTHRQTHADTTKTLPLPHTRGVKIHAMKHQYDLIGI